MTASIVINTYNRARSLERLLPSLNQLDGVPFEVVVVNGPSTDDTEAVTARYADRLKIARCPSANLSQSRNIGIAAAAGDVVVFIDDDALPGDAAWLRKLVDVFENDRDGRVGAAGGASIHRDTEWLEFGGGWTSDYGEQIFSDVAVGMGPAREETATPPVDRHGFDAGSRADDGAPAVRPVAVRSAADGAALDGTTTGGPRADAARSNRWYRRTVGNNSAFRRSALVDIGGFDERFLYYLDEADVCLRLVRAGFSVVYLQNCPVRHYPAVSPLGAPFIRDRRLIARSDTYYCLKNGADALPRRLLETVRRAPYKHFVSEMRDLVSDGRISEAELWRLRRQWLQGLVEGLALGLFASRATTVTAEPPPPLTPFARTEAEGRLSICLLSRRLPPDPHAGGVGRYTYDLARGLHELGHRVTVVTESDVPNRHEGLEFEVVGIRSGAEPSGLKQTPILAQNLAYAQAVAARVEALGAERGPFDVVHASNWGVEALGVAQRGLAPLVLMLVTPLECVIAAEGWDVSLDLAANIELDQWVVTHAARVCAPSSGVLDRYRARAQWGEPVVHRVPLGIVCQPATVREPRAPGGRRRLLFVGRLERRKGIHVLLEVLPRVMERHAEWQCDLVGNTSVPAGPGVTFASLFLAEHGSAPWRDRVRFHGAVSDEDLHRFYRDADLFVAPSLYESFGLIYQEAMQYGVPVVGCHVGGVPDVVAHEEHGVLVPAGDAAALEAALDRLMSDDVLRRQMGARAEATVRTQGSHLALAARMVEEYRAAIAARTGRRQAEAVAAAGARPTVAEAAIAVLERASPTRGLGLAFRASAALEHGARSEAAELFAAALGVWEHPDYFAMALELALGEGDMARAGELAARGFRATHDDSEACVTFAAVLASAGRDGVRAPSPAAAETDGAWPAWVKARAGASLGARYFAAALSAIRAGRDASAITLLESCLFESGADRGLRAQALFHLGSAWKRRGKPAAARVCFADVIEGGALADLPVPLRSALHFHAGELDLRAGDRAAAIAHFETCLSLNPTHGRARQLLDQAVVVGLRASTAPDPATAPAVAVAPATAPGVEVGTGAATATALAAPGGNVAAVVPGGAAVGDGAASSAASTMPSLPPSGSGGTMPSVAA